MQITSLKLFPPLQNKGVGLDYLYGPFKLQELIDSATAEGLAARSSEPSVRAL